MNWPEIRIGIDGMNYGLSINGILGMDLLIQTSAGIDLGQLTTENHADHRREE